MHSNILPTVRQGIGFTMDIGGKFKLNLNLSLITKAIQAKDTNIIQKIFESLCKTTKNL